MDGFLRNKVTFIVNTDLYILHHYHIYMEQLSTYPVRAYEADFEHKRKHILSTIGEFFEREVLCNTNPIACDEIIMTSLITGERRKINIDELIFRGKFTDSCGMASHTLSKEAIWKAYKEFFERQSFIANFIFHLKSTKIELDCFDTALRNDIYIKNYVDQLEYYNISLSKNIYVILALGWNHSSKAVGLGTSRSLKKAIEKAQKEIMQYYAVSCSKENCGHKEKEQVLNKDAYHAYFDQLSIKEILELYSYLKNGDEKLASVECQNIKKMNTEEIIKDNYLKLKMNPFIAVFSGRDGLGVKVVKIKDFNWFPHMRPALYTPEIISYLENTFGWKRQNFSDWLPFI